VKAKAFDIVINDKIMQVQISICSDVEDFLEDFQTVVINPFLKAEVSTPHEG
jgi:hypothetical protein